MSVSAPEAINLHRPSMSEDEIVRAAAAVIQTAESFLSSEESTPTERVRRAGLKEQKYGKSTLAYHAVGALAVNECLDTPEGLAAIGDLQKDHDSAVVEMMNSDEEMQDLIEVNRIDLLAVVNGQVVNEKGFPMVESIEDGRDKALEAAVDDPRMTTQVVRDQAHLRNARRVDVMASGKVPHNTRIVVSMEPVEAMDHDGDDYWREWGYRRSLAYIQLFHSTEQGMVTGSFSVDLSDKETWLDLLSELGLEIPPEASTDVWVEYGLETTMTTDQAVAKPIEIRQAYYKKRGQPQQRHSIDAILTAHKTRRDQRFRALCLPLARAAHTKEKNDVIHSFVQGLLPQASKFKPKVREGLSRIHENQTFTDDDVRLVESLIAYGTVESLRDDVKRAVHGNPTARYYAPLDMTPYEIAIDTANHVIEGVEAGRWYGGCPGLNDPSNINREVNQKQSPQEAYGGRVKDQKDKRNWKLKWDVCGIQDCPSRGKDPKHPEITLCGPCGVCMARCQKIYDLDADPATFRKSGLALVA